MPMPEGECTRCGRTTRLYVPRHGDGSSLITYWHKCAGDESRWCRSEVNDARYPSAASLQGDRP